PSDATRRKWTSYSSSRIVPVFAAALEVHRLVGEGIRPGVSFARHVPDGVTLEPLHSIRCLAVQSLEIRALDAIVAPHLPDQQLRVGVDLDPAEAGLARPVERPQQRGVFREVVGAAAEVLVDAAPGLPFQLEVD